MPELATTDQVYDPNGQPIEKEHIPLAVAEGRARFDTAAEYSMLDADGLPKIVKGDQVWGALQQGWTVESAGGRRSRIAQEEAGLGTKAASAALGAAESLTFGAAPSLTEAFAPEGTAQKWREITEAAPGAHTLGEVFGLVTPMGIEAAATKGLLKGGARTLGELGTALPRGVSGGARRVGAAIERALPEATSGLGKALRSGVRFGAEGAVEGAAYGVGQAITEASLGDSELTAERLLAAAGEGALLGGGLGAGIGAASVGAGALARRAQGSLSDFAEKQAWKATGATGANTRAVGLEQAKASGRRMLDEGLLKFEDFEQRAVALKTATKEAGQEIDRLITKIDDTGAKPNLSPIIEKVDQQLGRLRTGLGADVKLAKKLDKDFVHWMRERSLPGTEPTFKELHATRARIDDYFQEAKRAGRVTEQAEVGQLRTIVEDEIQKQADRIATQTGGEFLSNYTAAKSRYKDLVNASKVAELRAPMLEAGNRSISLTDTIAAVGGLATAGPGGLILGGANKLLREYGDVAAAKLADKLDKLTTLKAKTDKVATDIATGTRGALETKSQPVSTAAREVAKVGSYENASAPVREYQVAPERSAQKVAERAVGLTEDAPEAHRAVVSKATGDLQYLASQLPRAVSGILPGMENKVQPAASDQARFMRARTAVVDPLSVLVDLDTGKLSAEAVAALKERRPLLLDQIQQNAALAIAEMYRDGKVPDRQMRLQMARLTGQSGDPASNPAVIRAVQKHYSDKAKQMASPPAPARAADSATRKTDRVMSQTEALARGDT